MEDISQFVLSPSGFDDSCLDLVSIVSTRYTWYFKIKQLKFIRHWEFESKMLSDVATRLDSTIAVEDSRLE